MLDIRQLSRSFREGGRVHRVLEDLGAQIARGERVAVMGRSGSGKSTLLNLISGIDTADRGMCFRWSLHNRPPLRNWSTARATLLGDSAHATLPYLAQGAAMAIEDGAVLARALLEAATVPEALDLYQRNRVDRTARIVEQSTFNRQLFHLPSVAAMREAFAKRNEGEDRNKWLYSYNPLTVELV